MKTFQLEQNEIHFANHDRIDEKILFYQIHDILKSHDEINIGKKQIGPSEDYYKCTIEGKPFTLIYDIDYGAFIHAGSQWSLDHLIEIFNTSQMKSLT